MLKLFDSSGLAAVRFRPGRPRHLGFSKAKTVWKCAVCGYTTSDSSYASKHKKIHTGERPYKCGVCGKAFNRKSTLNTHARVHTGERPYQCHLCPWNSAWKLGLTRHLETHQRSQHSLEGASVLGCVMPSPSPAASSGLFTKKTPVEVPRVRLHYQSQL
ncbi:hypothetical protein MRX96_013425 [Rhipicephalus microplus]